MRHHRTAFTAGFLLAASGALAQPTWDAVPYVAGSTAPFTAMFAAGRTRTVRILILGDSQETSPGGAGDVYVPRLNYELWRRYGNTPETPFAPVGGNTGAGPPADWLVRTTQAVPGPIPASGSFPPGIYAWAFDPSCWGSLLSWERDGSYLDPGAIVLPRSYMAEPVRLEVFGTGTIGYQTMPSDTGQPSYWATVVDSGSVPLPGSTPFLGSAGHPYMHVVIGSGGTVTGARFVSADPHGVIVSSFSQGGYKASDFLANNSACGALIAQLGIDAVAVCYGANDSAAGHTPQQYAADMAAVRDLVRSWTRPNLPCFFFCDPYQSRLLPGQADFYDRYPGALWAVAQQDQATLLVNSRRALEDQGWSAGADGWLADGVHYTPLGARTKAATEMVLLDTMIGARSAKQVVSARPR